MIDTVAFDAITHLVLGRGTCWAFDHQIQQGFSCIGHSATANRLICSSAVDLIARLPSLKALTYGISLFSLIEEDRFITSEEIVVKETSQRRTRWQH